MPSVANKTVTMTRLLITLLLLCTMGAKAQTSQTLADFNARKAVLTHGHLFDIFNRTMTDGERDAMRFLYAYMPVNDIADYDGDFFLNQVRATLAVRTQARHRRAGGLERVEEVRAGTQDGRYRGSRC